MQSRYTRLGIASALAVWVAVATAAGQSAGAVQSHRAAARTAAGKEFQGLLARVCPEPGAAGILARGLAPATPQQGQGSAVPAVRPAPPRNQWYVEPRKVFDNFYFIGTLEHGAWAVTTPEGLIVIDALFDYAVIDEVEGGLKKLGLDPATMKYLIVTHGHGDHHGGTKYLQDKYRPRVVMGPSDWDLVARDTRSPRPTRDIAATDGQKITLGDTTVTIYITPGHTPSTISLLVPVRDGADRHVAAEWGGTAFSAATSVEALKQYIASAQRFRELASAARADVIFTNHTSFDGTLAKLAALGPRRPDEKHPFVLGTDAVRRYLTVAEECARAELAGR